MDLERVADEWPLHQLTAEFFLKITATQNPLNFGCPFGFGWRVALPAHPKASLHSPLAH